MSEAKKPKYKMLAITIGREVVHMEGLSLEGPDGRRRRFYTASPRQEKVRKSDPEIDRDWSAVESELEARRPGAVQRIDGSVVVDFTDEPELLARWMEVVDRAEAIVEAKLPPLPVKTGDFVEVNGRIFRVGHVNLHDRTVETQQLDATGALVSSVNKCHADMLTPLPHPPRPEEFAAPPPPAHLRSGDERARHFMRSHREHLQEAGVWTGGLVITKVPKD